MAIGRSGDRVVVDIGTCTTASAKVFQNVVVSGTKVFGKCDAVPTHHPRVVGPRRCRNTKGGVSVRLQATHGLMIFRL